MNKQKELGEEKVGKLLAKYSIPAIIAMVVNAFYNIVDRAYIGHIKDVGPLAIAGVGVTMPILIIVMGFGLLIGIGTAANISLRLGRGQKDEAEKMLGNAFTLIFIISILLTVIGISFSEQILTLFGASEEAMVFAKPFINILLAGTIFNLVGFGLNHSIRADGNPKIAMMSMLIGCAINLVLDPIFIFTFGLGIRGAAYATVLSQVVSAVWILYYFTKGKSNLKLKFRNLKLQATLVKSIVAIGMAQFFMQVAASLVQVVSNNALRVYGGDIAIGAMAIISSISMMFLMPVVGLNQGSQPIIGYNYGAKKLDRVKETVKLGVKSATIIVIVGFIIIEAVPELAIKIFNNDPELVKMGSRGIRIFLCMLPVIGFQIITSNYFQAVGKAKIATFLSLLRQVIILIPMLIILPKFFGLTGVWLAGPISDFLASLITAILFLKEMKLLKREECELVNYNDVCDNKINA